MENRVILVVDDEEAIRELVTEVLISEGYAVQAASDGREALTVLERILPSLILHDLNMPVFDGFAFVGELVARGIRVPTIVISAATNLPKYAADMGVAAFVAKPFDIPHLLTTVERTYRLG